ncbi:acyltransferase family protein [Tessaracoccus antarcticus]|nr:acyltransferase family protein [Tessaracoccus antarcticus]
MTPTSPHGARRMAALDGIRTIAVFLVILFHVSAPRAAAGFIGVDIFFVLSGYLITAGLMRETQRKGRISLGGFWLRRFKRLMPAALLTLAAVTVWMLWIAPLYQIRSVSTDLWWTLLYVANWHLMAANSYFSDTGAASPLLHMWSLAVEEQFYVAWPLILLATLGVALLITRRRRQSTPEGHVKLFGHVAGWLTVVLIIASAVTLYAVYDPAFPDRAYMGTDAKAFEPLLGALAAILLTNPGIKQWLTRHHRLLGWIGVGVMLALFPFLDGPPALYYQWGALAFSVGALFLIVGLVLAQGQGLLARVLGWEPIAYLGRISYGLYLWHWPLAIWIIGDREGFRWIRALAVVVLTVAAAAASYHLVEMPVRTWKWFTAKRSAVLAVVLLVTMLVAVSFGGGTPLSPVLQKLRPGDTLNRNIVLMVGDSVPQRFNPELEKAAAGRGLRIASATAGGCAPSGIDIPLYVGKPDVVCSGVIGFQTQALEQFHPGTVVWWSRYELADMRVDGEIIGPETERFWKITADNLQVAADRLRSDGATLVMVATDRIGVGVYAACTPEDCHPFLDRLAHHDEYRQRWNAMVQAFAKDNDRVTVIGVDDLYCTDDGVPCDDEHDGVLTRKDGSHFSDEKLMPGIAEAIIERVFEAANG